MKHIEFDQSLLEICELKMYSASTSQGGQITIDDNGQRVIKSVPKTFCNDFKKMYFKNPILVFGIKYGKKLLGFVNFDQDRFDYATEKLQELKDYITESGIQWYFDGEYIYNLTNIVIEQQFEYFSQIKMQTFDATHCLSRFYTEPMINTGLMYKDVISPPLFNNFLYTISRLFNIVDATQPLKSIDIQYACNLQGLLKICDMSSLHFGKESIECFDIPRYMLELKTVNLPKLPTKTKTTTITGLCLSDVVMFHLGKFKIADSITQIEALKNSLKYIISYCIVRNDMLESTKIYQKGYQP